jgi:catechol 2,3-dioxygenase-like lactoylglutathione lyase family enzyme
MEELRIMDLKLEIIVLPVADVDRAKEFYRKLGFREDVDYVGPEGFRVVQFTPPGSAASITIGSGITDAAPGSTQGIHLIVDDVIAAREDLIARGIEVSEVFHDAGGVFHHGGIRDRLRGPQAERKSYGSFLSFQDPDGNGFLLQEVTTRGPGRVSDVVYGSVADVEAALRDAAAAHGKHEQEIGHEDPDWPAWYAAYMAKAAGLGA